MYFQELVFYDNVFKYFINSAKWAITSTTIL